MDRVLKRDANRAWGHSPTEGLPVLREAMAHRFGGHPQNVLVLAGAQQGLDLLARCLVDPGDTVVVDRPGYLGALHAFNAAGARSSAGTSPGTTWTSWKISSPGIGRS